MEKTAKNSINSQKIHGKFGNHSLPPAKNYDMMGKNDEIFSKETKLMDQKPNNNKNNSGQVNKDMDSLLAAMNVIGSQDKDTVHNATVNGMNNDEMQAILGDIFGEQAD